MVSLRLSLGLAFVLSWLVPVPVCATGTAVSGSDVAASLASSFRLAASTTLPFPRTSMASFMSQTFVAFRWNSFGRHVIDGGDDLNFIPDPFPNSSTPGAPIPAFVEDPGHAVLGVTYPQGSYSGRNMGGAQLWSVWSTSFLSMLLEYEVAFDADFPFNLGGKLPGLRGGPDPFGCSGGHQATGDNCFSTRIMWRRGGAGEVYAYFPNIKNRCSDSNVICDDTYGTSIGRGSFTFKPGQWNRVSLLVSLNEPPEAANGFIRMYSNDVEVIAMDNLQIRTNEEVTVDGLYLSTFFGGHNSTWATPQTTHSYFRNIRLWGSPAGADRTTLTDAYFETMLNTTATASAPPTGTAMPTGQNGNGALATTSGSAPVGGATGISKSAVGIHRVAGGVWSALFAGGVLFAAWNLGLL